MPNLALPLSDPLHPSLTLLIQNGKNPELQRQIPVLIDTGFDDYLSIPIYLAMELDLEILGEDEVELANGEQYSVNMSRAVVDFLDLGCQVSLDVILGEDQEALLGTKTLELLANRFGIDFDKSELFFEELRF